MEDKEYNAEAIYLKKIQNWRRAIDERGLSSEQRQTFCNELLDFIVIDLMPDYKDKERSDFSLMDVNR